MNQETRKSFPGGCYSPIPAESRTTKSERDPDRRAYFNSDLNNKSVNVTNSQLKTSQPVSKAKKYKPYWKKITEKNETKKRLVKLLDQLSEHVLAANFQTCHSKFQSLTCGTHVADRKVNFYCGHRACPFCSAIRAQRIFEKYLPKTEAFFQSTSNATPVHLVLTQKHYKNESLSDSIQRLLGNFRKLIRRKFWSDHFFGGAYSVEFTIGKDGCWHAHLHIFAFRRRFFHVSIFRKLWKEITGDSVNFKIDLIDTLAGGLKEVVKYISKPLDVKDFKPDHLKQVLDLKGTRLFSTFGQFRAFCAEFESDETDQTPPEDSKAFPGDSCEHCGQTLHIVSLPIAEQIEFEKNILAARRRANELLKQRARAHLSFSKALSAIISGV